MSSYGYAPPSFQVRLFFVFFVSFCFITSTAHTPGPLAGRWAVPQSYCITESASFLAARKPVRAECSPPAFQQRTRASGSTPLPPPPGHCPGSLLDFHDKDALVSDFAIDTITATAAA